MKVERTKPKFKPIFITLETRDEIDTLLEALSDFAEGSEEASIMYSAIYKTTKGDI